MCLFLFCLSLPCPHREKLEALVVTRIWTVIPVRLLVPSEQTDLRKVLEYISWLALSFGHSWNKAKIGLLTKGSQFISGGSPTPKINPLGTIYRYFGGQFMDPNRFSLRKKIWMQKEEQLEEVESKQLIWRPSRERHVQREHLNFN